LNVLVVGAGIIGLTFAYTWQKKFPKDSITIIDKESREAMHASGKNSGILHAGFYYASDSLKAKLTAVGNKMMKEFCHQKGIYVKNSGKLVVAKNEDELKILFELQKRGEKNRAKTKIVDEKEAKNIEPLVKTYKYALYSPNTASVDPKAVCKALREDLEKKGVKFLFNTPFERYNEKFDFLINAAGLYSDKIAHFFGVGKNYLILPFKGLYLKYNGKKSIKTQIYPVPNIKNPFLGIHFTLMADNTIKIGPTAIPAFWKEQYGFFDNFKADEFLQILGYEAKLFFKNRWFRDLAYEEIRYYYPKNIIKEAKKLVKSWDDNFSFYPPGIRAQLLNKKTNKLIMDFLVEKKDNQIHILNAVSPAFTASFAFAEYVLKNSFK